ncbi:hypothetical protein FPOAC2_03623 [Fusarium poae]|jgi:hypothetical protein|uniref:2EXR domain-containing protein n=1 Tax=Fusarium poae TaxID=36050 RepID=A0A1B8B9J6_FUSPO|nr:hypothetical protein FPOAC1_003486 [Fusarium poae]KAG8677468.1 hypothetical protein FPOAC1_003486 [Fusarium poae]OBS29401.1 hypothetical protein FPOA_03337 [Fusarium poae]
MARSAIKKTPEERLQLRLWKCLRPPPSRPRFPLNRLPPEIRQIIWTLSFADRPHKFTVGGVSEQDSDSNKRFFLFKCYLPLPPAALYVCRESRATALRHGFLFSAPDGPGIWFRPEIDSLYFSPTTNDILTTKNHIDIQGWGNVLHLQMSFRAFYRNLRDPPQEDLAETMEVFFAHMPNLKTLSCTVPAPRIGGNTYPKPIPMPLPGSGDTYALIRGRTVNEVLDLVQDSAY